MNPIFPREIFIPDGEARWMPDGRLYVYGSLDNSGDTEFCSTRYLGFSTDDMVHWKSHGVIFESGNRKYKNQMNRNLTLGAPDCVYKNGKYYLYYCTYGSGQGAAVSDYPYGPFSDIGRIAPADGDGIDPAVFVDEDGKAYYYWGQFQLKGAMLNEDMCSLNMETIRVCLANEQEHGFHEGASMRKYNGIYYLVYTDISRGRATCLSYAVSDSPLGPFEKKGVIIDNIGCDSQSWNNHGSIEEFEGKWYVFYHRSSQNSIYNRRMCVEPIYFTRDGLIPEVEMTSCGAGPYLDSSVRLDASSASRIKKALPFDNHIEPIRIEPRSGHGEVIAYTKNNDWAEYKYLDFKEGRTEFTISASSPKDSAIELMLEDGNIIGRCEITNTGGWDHFQQFTCNIKKTEGIHPLWINFHCSQGSVGRQADIEWFYFK